jgi:hypothetical protein
MATLFIGHFALGLAAKRATPRVSLGILFLAAQFADTLWPFLLAVGLEQVRIHPGDTAFTPLDFFSYPYSHSLVTLVVWGLVLGVAYRSITGLNGRTVAVLTALVVSHWILDVATHRADMPVYPGGPKIGFGLWNSVPATLIVETALFAAGLWIYLNATRARDGIGRWGFVALVAFLLAAYAGAAFGDPPPSLNALIAVSISAPVILLPFTSWVDGHRDSKE